MAVYADDSTTTTDQTTTQPTDTQQSTPVADPATTTDPATTSTTPSSTTSTTPPPETYTYDSSTGRWNTSQWQYNADTNQYEPVPQPAPAPETTASAQSSPAAEPGTALDSTTTTNIKNALDSLAKTGDAGVTGNASAGGATSGNADVSATVINNVNSTLTNADNKQAATFVTNVMGDVNGDIMLQPMLLKAMIEANAQKGTNSLTSSNQTAVTNTLNLNAQSGNATVADNTKAGGATSGDANTVADVLNMLNSMVAANQSFMGTINIYGNLNGDILIAPDFIPQLLASNGGSTANAATSTTSKDTQSIVNNVSLAAKSGEALVTDNTDAGSATTGNANTNLVIFNLSGHQIVASNSLLVFINVLGRWVGVIVDAPQGATAAAIGDNVARNDIQPSMVVDATNNATITNNLTLNSVSGDATVKGNTQAGNARSGNATASANIANISNSVLGLSGWFGILFINVFGTWNGSFGIDTAAGNTVEPTGANPSGTAPQVFRFIPHTDQSANRAAARMTIIDPSASQTGSQPTTGETTSALKSAGDTDRVSDIPDQQSYINARTYSVPLMVASLIVVGGSLVVLRRYLF